KSVVETVAAFGLEHGLSEIEINQQRQQHEAIDQSRAERVVFADCQIDVLSIEVGRVPKFAQVFLINLEPIRYVRYADQALSIRDFHAHCDASHLKPKYLLMFSVSHITK